MISCLLLGAILSSWSVLGISYHVVLYTAWQFAFSGPAREPLMHVLTP